jgi:hypothetical protein
VFLLFLTVVVFGYLGIVRFQVGSFSEILPYINGKRLFHEPAFIDLTKHRSRDGVFEVSVVFTNRSGNNKTLMGATRSCSCISTESFPIIVPPNKSIELSIKVRESSQPQESAIEFYSDDSGSSGNKIVLSGGKTMNVK